MWKMNRLLFAWLLTHPHPDHIGAFNVIFESPEGIEIGAIYDNGLDYEYFAPVAFDWDGLEGDET
jgi:glyoxylase-like metal-dependent hydrolase (beta-lactamase superfamily II)